MRDGEKLKVTSPCVVRSHKKRAAKIDETLVVGRDISAADAQTLVNVRKAAVITDEVKSDQKSGSAAKE